MTSKRECLRLTAAGAAAVLAGCSGLVPSGPGSETDSNDCERSTEIPENQYEFSRPGQVRAKPVAEASDDWSSIQFSDCIHGDVRTPAMNAHEIDDLQVREISATVREDVRHNLHSHFGVTRPKFYVDYRGDPVEIIVMQYD